MIFHFRTIKVVFFFFVLALVACLSYFVSGRDESIGTDTYSYRAFFYIFINDGRFRISEPFFLLLAQVSSLLSEHHRVFFFLISFFSSISLLVSASASYKSLAEDGGRRGVLFLCSFILVCLFSPFFINGQINLLRSALAVPFIFFAFLFFYQKKYLVALMAAGCAVMFHFTYLLFVPMLLLVRASRRTVLTLVGCLVCLYMVGLPEIIFSSFSPFLESMDRLSYYSKYGNEAGGYQTGTRYDFLAFSVFFFLLSYWFGDKSRLLDFCFKVYSACLIPFLLIGFIAYSDRLLFSAWMFIPVIAASLISTYAVKGVYIYMALFFLFVIGFFWFLIYSGIFDYRIL